MPSPTPSSKQSNHNNTPQKKHSPQKKSRTFTVKVCTSQKSCGDHYGPFIWERICNENNEKIDQDSFEKNGITYKKSACQGRCKRASNVQVEDTKKNKTTQFSYMNPLKAAKLISSIRSGAAPENIKRL